MDSEWIDEPASLSLIGGIKAVRNLQLLRPTVFDDEIESDDDDDGDGNAEISQSTPHLSRTWGKGCWSFKQEASFIPI